MLSRLILGEPIVFFRKTDGAVVALEDRCAHRFVPLHLGRLEKNVIECKYHGLKYDETGNCIFNPHGDGKIPPSARVKSYTVVERCGVIWIWMGDAARADRSQIRDFSQFDDSGPFTSVTGYLYVAANYQLISDNLLDLTHGQYVHPLFANPAGPATMEVDTSNEPDTVWAKFVRRNQYPNQYFQMLGYPKDQRGDHRNYMRWNAPGVLLLDVGMTSVGGAPSEGISIPTAHLLTPETLTSTHYLWGMARNFRLDDASFSDQLLETGMRVFETEDKPIIEAQQRAMGASDDLIGMKPALLQTDRATLRARRLLERMIRHERGEAVEPPADAGSVQKGVGSGAVTPGDPQRREV
jgi:phenylpropionate dioxygenase-like ring-hydroxylating dioxygenase large terminal subunit